MATEIAFDLKAAHRYFSAFCFNAAWDLIDKPKRTPEEDQQMVTLNCASQWHWRQREDCTDRNLAVGYWQASRIYALLKDADTARKYGELSLKCCEHVEEPFYAAYAYEGLARAEAVANNSERMQFYLEKARKQAEAVQNEDEKTMLLNDLKTIMCQ